MPPLYLLFSFLLFPEALVPDLDSDLARLLQAPPNEAPRVIDQILRREPRLDQLASALTQEWPSTASVTTGPPAGWSAGQATDVHGTTRPYQLYVPESVAQGKRAAALVVHLHGSVARPEFGSGLADPRATGYASILWPGISESSDVVVAAPLGRSDCAWWTRAGVDHVRAVVRDVKRRLPVPDDGVFAAGFSDGASGCYYLAMTAPDPFAGFLALNGHPAVASAASGQQLYLRNLATTPLAAFSTQEDSLYPSRSVLPHLALAISLGAEIHALSYPGMNHQPGYFQEQETLVRSFLSQRREERSELRWLASSVELGAVRWIEMLELGTLESDGEALEDTNLGTQPGRIRLGVQLGGTGLEVQTVVEPSLAAELGMQAGDELLEVNASAIENTRELRAALRATSHGDAITVRIRRGNERVTLQGKIPEFVSAPIYLRAAPTSHVDVRIGESQDGAPRIELTSHGVRSVRIWLPKGARRHPHATLIANGREQTISIRKRTPREALEAFARTGDRAALRFAYVEVDLGAGK